MADVVPSKTIEINDAVFCLGHFKEVVRSDMRTSIITIPISPPIFDYIAGSAPTAMSTCGRKMMAFSEYA